MKYKNIMRIELATKLINTAFSEPVTNIIIGEFHAKTLEIYTFLQREFEKNTENQEYLNKLLEEEISNADSLTALNLTKENFKSCVYSAEKDYWITPREMVAIIDWCKKKEGN